MHMQGPQLLSYNKLADIQSSTHAVNVHTWGYRHAHKRTHPWQLILRGVDLPTQEWRSAVLVLLLWLVFILPSVTSKLEK